MNRYGIPITVKKFCFFKCVFVCSSGVNHIRVVLHPHCIMMV